MNVTIRKIGNSEGIIIPRELLQRLGLKAGDSVELVEADGGIRLIAQPEDLAEQLAAAREGMAKYRVALRELAK
jgi:putative addiction module antidote